MATHSSILAWEIPWTEEPGKVTVHGSQRVGRDRTCTQFQPHCRTAAVADSHGKHASASGLTCCHTEEVMQASRGCAAVPAGGHSYRRYTLRVSRRECVSPDPASLLRAVPGREDLEWTDGCLFHYMHLLPARCLKRNSFGHREVFTQAPVIALQLPAGGLTAAASSVLRSLSVCALSPGQ